MVREVTLQYNFIYGYKLKVHGIVYLFQALGSLNLKFHWTTAHSKRTLSLHVCKSIVHKLNCYQEWYVSVIQRIFGLLLQCIFKHHGIILKIMYTLATAFNSVPAEQVRQTQQVSDQCLDDVILEV